MFSTVCKYNVFKMKQGFQCVLKHREAEFIKASKTAVRFKRLFAYRWKGMRHTTVPKAT